MTDIYQCTMIYRKNGGKGMNNIKIAPSILSGDFANMGASVIEVNNSGSDLVHIDVMDGVYVPNLTFGMPMVKAIKRYAKLPLDVHLMIVNPEKYIAEFIDCGADIITFHPEVCSDTLLALQIIKSKGVKCGLVINPDKPIDIVLPYLDYVDVIMFMGVYPGFSNQKFIADVLSKIKPLKNIIDERGLDIEIEFDGGVGVENAPELVKLGVTILVSGSAFFKADNQSEFVKKLKGKN